jgi:hypothetical protein
MGIARLKIWIFIECLFHVQKIDQEAQALLLATRQGIKLVRYRFKYR